MIHLSFSCITCTHLDTKYPLIVKTNLVSSVLFMDLLLVCLTHHFVPTYIPDHEQDPNYGLPRSNNQASTNPGNGGETVTIIEHI